MAKNSIADWSTTAASNTDVGSIDLQENVMRPPAVNNAFREIMKQVADAYGVDVTFSAAQQAQFRENVSAPLKGHIYGLTLSNNSTDATNDIDIAAGEAASTETNPVLMVLASTLVKRLDAAWAVGTGNGGLDTGSIANTTYHIWLIRRSDTGVVDALFSASASSPTMPTNYDQKRRIGSIVRTGGVIKAFKQIGDEFLWDASAADVSGSASSSSAATVTLTVPTGIVVDARVSLLNNASANIGAWLSSLEVSDQPPGTGGYTAFATTVAVATGPIFIRTNTSGQIRRRESGAGATITLWTEGFKDTRGRL